MRYRIAHSELAARVVYELHLGAGEIRRRRNDVEMRELDLI